MSSAFVIMPFAAELKGAYEDLIRPACGELGVTVHRADEIARHRNIMRDIVEGLITADVIVAELTTRNPNVYYELGAAHALLRPVVVVTQDVNTLPFDLRLQRVIQYDPSDARQARPLLVEAIRSALAVEYEPSNPIGEHVPPEAIFKLVQANRRLRPVGSLRLVRREGQVFLRIEGDLWKGLVVEPSYPIKSVNWGASGSTWGQDGNDVVSTPYHESELELGPLPLTGRGDVRGTPYIRTIHGEMTFLDLYAWNVSPSDALMKVEIDSKGGIHRSGIIEYASSAVPTE